MSTTPTSLFDNSLFQQFNNDYTKMVGPAPNPNEYGNPILSGLGSALLGGLGGYMMGQRELNTNHLHNILAGMAFGGVSNLNKRAEAKAKRQQELRESNIKKFELFPKYLESMEEISQDQLMRNAAKFTNEQNKALTDGVTYFGGEAGKTARELLGNVSQQDAGQAYNNQTIELQTAHHNQAMSDYLRQLGLQVQAQQQVTPQTAEPVFSGLKSNIDSIGGLARARALIGSPDTTPELRQGLLNLLNQYESVKSHLTPQQQMQFEQPAIQRPQVLTAEASQKVFDPFMKSENMLSLQNNRADNMLQVYNSGQSLMQKEIQDRRSLAETIRKNNATIDNMDKRTGAYVATQGAVKRKAEQGNAIQQEKFRQWVRDPKKADIFSRNTATTLVRDAKLEPDKALIISKFLTLELAGVDQTELQKRRERIIKEHNLDPYSYLKYFKSNLDITDDDDDFMNLDPAMMEMPE